jgi:hypothetical protein
MHLTDKTVSETESELTDDFSDAIDIDFELTDTIETISDTIDNSSDDPAANIIDSPSTGDDLYDFIQKALLSLDPIMTMALGKITYHTHFHPHYSPPEKEGGFGKTLYKKSPPNKDIEPDELGLVFFGEVCPSIYGTAISAKGNHYAGSPKHPKVCTAQISLLFIALRL